MSANTLFPETGPIMGFVGSMAGCKALKAIARITGVILPAMMYFSHIGEVRVDWGKLNSTTSQAANTTVLSRAFYLNQKIL